MNIMKRIADVLAGIPYLLTCYFTNGCSWNQVYGTMILAMAINWLD